MPFVFKSDVPILDAWMLLNQIYDNISHCRDNIFISRGITRQQHGVLLAIKYVDSLPTESQIAEWMDKKLNTVSTILDRMEKAGLVRRVKNFQDRRSYCIRITKKGEGILKINNVPYSEQIKDIMGCLSGEEIQILIKLLGKVRLQALRQLGQEKSLKEVNIDDTDPVVQFLKTLQLNN
jgi:DNA-binding MarR family transcriptional regulator